MAGILYLIIMLQIFCTVIATLHVSNATCPANWEQLDILTNPTLLTTPNPELPPRHSEEKSRLLQRLRRDTGKWDSKHPRHRLLTALHGFYRYKDRNLAEVSRWRDLYKHVPKRQRKLVESTIKYTSKLNTVEHLFDTNAVLARAIVDHALQFYGIERSELEQFVDQAEAEGKQADKTSVNQAMKHLVRDWADEGRHEREAAFPCILDALSRFVLDAKTETLRVLLPGAGLGRLAHEIAGLGDIEVTTNEWSSYMNLAYRYLSTLSTHSSSSFHPYIDWWSHQSTTADLTRAVSFPDVPVHASSVLLVEGDFTTAFPDASDTYDVIVTLFFIDTARNIVSYLETIHRLLRPGGKWINLGPLLWGSAPFLQLSLDEILHVSERIGFEFLETEGNTCGELTIPGRWARGVQVPYASGEKALTRNAYMAQFWVARKKSSRG